MILIFLINFQHFFSTQNTFKINDFIYRIISRFFKILQRENRIQLYFLFLHKLYAVKKIYLSFLLILIKLTTLPAQHKHHPEYPHPDSIAQEGIYNHFHVSKGNPKSLFLFIASLISLIFILYILYFFINRRKPKF